MGLYAQRYGNGKALFDFSLLNELVYVNLDKLQSYYKMCCDAVRRQSNDSYIIINPPFTPFDLGTEQWWIDFMNTDQGYTKVGLDWIFIGMNATEGLLMLMISTLITSKTTEGHR